MFLATQFPSWIKPEIIPGLPIRWYGLMYFVAFGIAWFLFTKQTKEIKETTWNDDKISSLFFWGILGLLLGARIFSAIVYDVSGEYLRKPWLVFWPFRDGRFVGLQGMSFHGGLIGCLAGITLYCLRYKQSIRDTGDMLAAAIPLGYTFGRLGNFINGELWGRVTSSPLGMIFPHAEKFPARLDWVREIAEASGVAIPDINMWINLPRHPSQLYEALFEGVVLWLVLWFLRKHSPFRGFIMGMYVMGYGLVRFIIEYFRQPDSEIGYRLELVKTDIPPALFSSVFNLSTGQILCLLMILGSAIWLIIAARLPQNDKKGATIVQAHTAEKQGSEKSSTGGKQ